MNILNKLTLRSLTLNKKRTIVTIIGIMLSCALICAVSGMVSSFQGSILERAKQTDGNYHVRFNDVPAADRKYIENNKNVKQVMYLQSIGFAKLEGSQNKNKPYIHIMGLDKAALENNGLELIEGRLPQNENEVIISSHIETNGKVKYRIGDTITLGVGNRMSEGYPLDQSNPYYTPEEEGYQEESLENVVTKQYTVVGVMKRPKMESYDAPGYTMITNLNTVPEGTITMNVLYHNPKDTYKVTKEIAGESEDSDISYTYNAEILKWSGVTNNSYITNSLNIVAGIVIVIIIFTSIFVIRNSFSISVTERLRQYGMLASVGATSKQIKKNVLFEGLILGIIAVPLGIIFGILADFILIQLVNLILGDSLNDIVLALSVEPLVVILTVVLSAVTIFLSCLIPARRASKISPIDAIRSNNDVNIKSKKLKTSKLFKKLFGIEGEIAQKNLKRSRKKYRTTIFSIFCSIVIFISLSTFITFAFSIGSVFYEESDYNIRVNERGDTELKERLDYFHKIEKLDNIERYAIEKMQELYINSKQYLSEKGNEIDNYEKDPEIAANGRDVNVQILAIGDVEYNRYIKELGGKPEDYEGKGILIDNNISNEDGKRIGYNYLNVKEGDTIHGYIMQEGKGSFEAAKKDVSVPVKMRTDKYPFGLSMQGVTNSAYLIVSDKQIEQYGYRCYSMTIKSNDPDKLQQDIQNIDKSKKDNVYNQAESVRSNNAMVLVISIFLYGFIGVISLIGVTNIFNTITTNMSLRSKEFAVLKSIGMTDKEFKKMIHYESLFYGLKSLLFGIPVGIGLSYCIYNGFKGMYDTAYVLPWEAILISIVFVFVIVFATMGYSRNKVKKQNIIETIRNENI